MKILIQPTSWVGRESRPVSPGTTRGYSYSTHIVGWPEIAPCFPGYNPGLFFFNPLRGLVGELRPVSPGTTRGYYY
ncbi:MAG TPA: hypothetical protein P5338_10120 [Bacteroidales bacterium]|nr:hypothetical protein [Bacteroidales bacterium]